MNGNFGSFIVELRKEKNLTQKELADKLNVSDKAVSRWENGRNYPDIGILSEIGKIFEVSVSELLEGKRLEHNEVVAKSDNRIVDAYRKTKRIKTAFIILAAAVLIAVAVAVGFGIKEYKNPVIENYLDLPSSDTRCVLDNINAFISPQEDQEYTVYNSNIFMNSRKETSDLYIEGATINDVGYHCGALGDYNNLDYTFVYKHKENEEWIPGILCTDYTEFIDKLDFKAIDSNYSDANEYNIKSERAEFYDEKIKINNNSARYLYSKERKELIPLQDGDNLCGEYALIMVYRVYNGSGTLLSLIYFEIQ